MDKELLDAVRAVHSGKRVISAEASFQIAEHSTDDALTPAEIRVLSLIGGGNANKEIADLSVSEETIKSQVRSILSKLGANDRTHAAMIGLKRGIIEFSHFRTSKECFAQTLFRDWPLGLITSFVL